MKPFPKSTWHWSRTVRPFSQCLSGTCFLQQTSRLTSKRYLHVSTSKQQQKPLLPESELAKYRDYYQDLKRTINEIPETVASKSPALRTLHKRLQLPDEFAYSTLSRCLTCPSAKLPDKINNPSIGAAFINTVPTNKYLDNHGLNILGKNLLSFHVTKSIIQIYPRLPTVVLNAAVNAYISEAVLAHIAKYWGIEVETTSIISRYLKLEPFEFTLGRLRFFNNSLNSEDGIELITGKNFSETSALAMSVRSIIAAVWAVTEQKDSQAVYKFIDNHIMSRKLDITKMFQFEQPTRELAMLCRREGLEKPVSKLVAESGRLSKAPVFIVHVFSGEETLGEGYGSSLKEAKARAATDALMKWYCYEPLSQQEPVIDPGTVVV
ncbi:Mrpl3p [Saccharomyces cerevisiae x Saccharomyces kudriavzevii VIN7]|uniref:Large ribosomal subunit protein mL44 n=1 Tax=Saccharomyces cerevisiae x Saccharomyces kudriavzevii (strain VIN7) TaxID=1095631 RepID=H0GZ72_SACCK|nr:Mrpl3p [Saccharomyces cerevisiae x Saccharomyces kudriavzevii VIN7]